MQRRTLPRISKFPLDQTAIASEGETPEVEGFGEERVAALAGFVRVGDRVDDDFF